MAEDTLDGHDTAMKGAVTDGLKRAFRSFGVQFGNGFYGDQPQAGNAPQPQRVPAQSLPRTGYGANGNSGQAQSNGNPGRNQANDRAEAQAEKLRRRLIEIAAEQGLDEDQVRSAVVDRTGKRHRRLDGRRPRAAGGGPPPTSCGRCSRRRPPSPPVNRDMESSGVVSHLGRPRSLITGKGGNDDDHDEP